MRQNVIIVVSCVVLSLAGIFMVAALHGQSEREARLMICSDILRQAHAEVERTGILPVRNGSWPIRRCTNEVQVGGRPLRLSIAIFVEGEQSSAGSFAMARSGDIIWWATNSTPVVVSVPGYRVPLWRDGF